MRKYIFICDKCKKEEVLDSNCLPDTWRPVRLQVTFNQYSYHETILCPECIESLGIVEPTKTRVSQEDVRDRLYNIIQEIVGGNNGN